MKVIKRIRRLVEDKNRFLWADVLIQLGMGLLFSFMIYGFLFALILYISILVFSSMFGLPPVVIALLAVLIYFSVATWSAWQRVDPMRGLKKLTDLQMTLTIISQMTSNTLYFSPRHATAAFATLLMGGPINFFIAWGTWQNRLPNDDGIIEEAAQLLKDSREGMPLKEVTHGEAALLLRRLILITVVERLEGQIIKPSDKGLQLLAKAKHKRKPKRTSS